MRVFITGASGWIGSATVEELVSAGHDVVGLVRSDVAATALEARGATARRGDLDDMAGIGAGAEDADAVIHLANKHDFSDQAKSNAAERAAVEAIGSVLRGTHRPFLLAAGVAGLAGDRLAVETDRTPFHGPDAPRGGSENLALGYLDEGITTVSLRFAPTVHGDGDKGFIAILVAAARAQGVSAYVGDGEQRWPAVHRSDAAALIRLALEDPAAMPVVHAVAEEGVRTRDVAAAIGRGLGLPVASIAPGDAAAHFGFLGGFFATDLATSSAKTRERLGWTPSGPTLVEDLAAGSYFCS